MRPLTPPRAQTELSLRFNTASESGNGLTFLYTAPEWTPFTTEMFK